MKLKITVHGVAYEVDVEVLDAGEGFKAMAPLPNARTVAPRSAAVPSPALSSQASPMAPPGHAPADASTVVSPIAGTIVEVKGKPGDSVEKGDVLLVIEAMKMNTSIAAPSAGKIRSVAVAAGDAVREGQTLVEFD